MNWELCNKYMWVNGMNSDMNFEFYKSGIVDNGVFFILKHYNKSYGVKGYSVWYQDASHVQQGGANFALKIKTCKSFDDGKAVAEKFYTAFKSGKQPKTLGTQYITFDTYLNGPFCE